MTLKLCWTAPQPGRFWQDLAWGRIRHLSVKVLWLQHKVETKEVHVSAVGTADNIADLGTKRLNCNTTRYLMHLCGVFNGSELVGKAEYDEMQRKRLLSRMSQNQQLLNVNYRILQLALLMNMPDNALSLEPEWPMESLELSSFSTFV